VNAMHLLFIVPGPKKPVCLLVQADALLHTGSCINFYICSARLAVDIYKLIPVILSCNPLQIVAG
jgi:hypothetical protein